MKLKYDFEMMELDDEMVAVPVGDTGNFKGVIQLNATASEIFKYLSEETSIDTIVDGLKNDGYATPETEIREYVEQFCQELNKNGFLE